MKKKKVHIMGIIDNNPKLIGNRIEQISVLSYSQIKPEYDYIVITAVKYEPIAYQLKRESVGLDRVISYYNMEDCNNNKGHIFKGKAWKIDLLEYKLEQLEKTMDIRMRNMGYEIIDRWNGGKYQLPVVREAEEAVNKIVNEKKSLLRFGDGEFEIIAGKNRAVFQSCNELLSARLREAIMTEDDRILIAIANNYGSLAEYTDDVADGIRRYMSEEVRGQHQAVLSDRIYYDAYLFKGYFPYRDKTLARQRYDLVKKIWDKQQVVLIEGDMTRTGCGNDLLDNALGVERILGPTTEAFAYYQDLLQEVRKLSKDKLILVALGPAGKVLGYDLIQEGYQVVDIGQLDMDYEWYLAGAEYRISNPNKYVSQLPTAYVGDWEEEAYHHQILARVGVK